MFVKEHRTAVGLALLAFVVYNANLRSITSLDTLATRFVPISVIKEFDLDLDEFPSIHTYPNWAGGASRTDAQDGDPTPYFVRRARGHYMSTYPVMSGILSVPVYVVPVLLGLTEGPPAESGYSRSEIAATLLSKISASAAVAISVAFVYLTLLRLTSRRGAFWIALVYAFATGSWSLSSQGLWQSAMGQPALALALYFLVRARENPRVIAYAGLWLAVSVACRPSNVVFAAVLFAYVFHRYRSQVFRFLAAPIVIGSLLLAYNFYYFGNLAGGYSEMVAAETFTTFRWDAFMGLLFSPSRGLLAYSPVFIFAVLGVGKAVREKRDPIFIYAAVATVLLVLFYSFWPVWHGQFNYGYRLIVESVPALCLLLAPIVERVLSNRLTKALFIALFAYATVIQSIGVFFYPCGWLDSPLPANTNPQRFWDWRDPEFLRCLSAGPVEPDGLRFLRELAGKR